MQNTFQKEIILPNEKERVAALRRYKLLGTYAESSFVNIANLVAEIFQASIAMISLVDAEEVSFRSSVGMSNYKGPRGESFCSLTVLKPEVNVIENALEDPVVAQNPLVCGDFGLRFYAGAPLITHDGYLIGTVCLVDTGPRTFSQHDRKILEGLAKVVMEQIELRLQNLLDSEKLTADNEKEHAENDLLVESQNKLTSINEQLQLSEGRFKNLIRDATFGIILLTGKEMKVEIVNDVYAKLIGRKGHELLNTELFTLIPETEAYFRPLIEKVRTTGEPLNIYDTPYTVNHNGQRIDGYLSAAYQPYRDNDGNIAGVMVFTQDVTDQVISRFKLKEADEMAGLAITAAKLGAWHIEPVTKALIYNQTLADIFGYEGNIPMTYEQAVAQVADEDRQRILLEIDQAIAGHGDYDITYQQRRFNDEKLIWLRSFGKVSPDIKGNFTVFSGFVMDVTEQKKEEQRKSDFIGMVSHELKTPLTSLSAYLQMLSAKAKKNEDSFSAGALERSLKQVKRMGTLINGFLNVSRLESGKIHMDKQPFDFAELFKETEQETSLLYDTRKVNFVNAVSTIVHADRDKIGQVLNNFISNAIKYSRAETVVTVSYKAALNQLQVSVTDHGIGIKDHELNKLFDRYYRVENENTQLISGFGIGLYLCAEIIDQHQGKVWAESKEGVGSTFHFTLPLVEQ